MTSASKAKNHNLQILFLQILSNQIHSISTLFLEKCFTVSSSSYEFERVLSACEAMLCCLSRFGRAFLPSIVSDSFRVTV